MNDKQQKTLTKEKVVKRFEKHQLNIIEHFDFDASESTKQEATEPVDTALDKVLDAVNYVKEYVGSENLKVMAAVATLPNIQVATAIGRAVAAINPILGGTTFLASMGILWGAPIMGTIKLLDKADERKEILEKYEIIKQAESKQSQSM